MNQKPNESEDERPAPGTEPPAAGAPVERAAGEQPERDVAADQEPPLVGDSADDSERTPPAPRAGRGLAAALALLALLLALLSLAAAGYLWWTGRDSGAAAAENETAIRRVSGTLEAVQGSLRDLEQRAGDLEAAGDRHADELSDVQAQLEQIRDRFASLPGRLSSLESSMSSLQGVSTGARDAWLLAEAEHYLQIANAQLQLAGNPERALLALRYADQRILQLADPALSDVRRALSRELRAVEAMEKPDIEGISMTLASLADSLELLPLKEDAAEPDSGPPEPPADASGLDRALASVKAAFSDIVTVRRTDEAVTPLMSPDAAYFLRANLALKLQTARLALLRGQEEIFKQSLNDAASWLQEYYEAESQGMQSALETLADLRAAEFTVTPPDISESLRLLREFRQRNAAAAPDAPADEPAQ